jgi:hypothetical protein
MDRGYDSEEINELIRDSFNSCSLSPVRNKKTNEYPDITEKDSLSYSIRKDIIKRYKVETAFSVLKRELESLSKHENTDSRSGR